MRDLVRPPFHCDYGYNVSLSAGCFLNFNCVILGVCEVVIGEKTQVGRNRTMLYTRQVLRPGEEVLAVGKFHWLYSLAAYLSLVLLGVFVVGIIIFLKMMIRKWTTEIVITKDRVIYKTGWIARHTEEIALVQMEEVSLAQTVLRRILGYGTLRIFGTGISAIHLPPMLSRPVDFRRALAEGREEARHPVITLAGQE